VSAANVAQLAADLLIASLSLRLIGVFDSCDLVPVVGGRDDGEEGVSTPLEREPSAQLSVFPFLPLKTPRSFRKRRVRRFGHSAAVTRLACTCSLCRIPKLRPLTPDFPPAEKARIYRYSSPVSSGIQLFRDPVFVRRRHVEQDRCADDVRNLFEFFARFRLAHSALSARPRITFAHQILHLGRVRHYPPSLSFPFQNIHRLFPNTPVLHTTKGRSLSSPVAVSHGGSSPAYQSPGKFQQPHFFSSCSKATIGLMRHSWRQL